MFTDLDDLQIDWENEQLVELVVTIEELRKVPPKVHISHYLLEQACKKANRLGKEKMKIKRIHSQRVGIDTDWQIFFICEKDIF